MCCLKQIHGLLALTTWRYPAWRPRKCSYAWHNLEQLNLAAIPRCISYERRQSMPSGPSSNHAASIRCSGLRRMHHR